MDDISILEVPIAEWDSSKLSIIRKGKKSYIMYENKHPILTIAGISGDPFICSSKGLEKQYQYDWMKQERTDKWRGFWMLTTYIQDRLILERLKETSEDIDKCIRSFFSDYNRYSLVRPLGDGFILDLSVYPDTTFTSHPEGKMLIPENMKEEKEMKFSAKIALILRTSPFPILIPEVYKCTFL